MGEVVLMTNSRHQLRAFSAGAACLALISSLTLSALVAPAFTAPAFGAEVDPQAPRSEVGGLYAGATPDAHPATVQVHVGPATGSVSTCSGVFVGPGIVLTAAHCFSAFPNGPARVYDRDSWTSNPALVAVGLGLAVNSGLDLAVLKVNNATHPWAEVASTLPSLGEQLQICGQNQIFNQNTDITNGRTSDMVSGRGNYCGQVTLADPSNPTIKAMLDPELIMTNPIVVDQGDSGGPTYNSRGEVVGILLGASQLGSYTVNRSASLIYAADWLRAAGVNFTSQAATPAEPTPAASPAAPALPASALRVAGADRVETSLKTFQSQSGIDTALLVTGRVAADGLAATQLTSVYRAGVVLTMGTSGLESAVIGQLTNGSVKRVVRVGGGAVLSANDRAALQAAGVELIELVGANRFETAAKVAALRDSLGGKPARVYVADGLNFPDALSAGAAAGQTKAPLVLSAGGKLPAETVTYLQALGSPIVAVGGPADQAVKAAGLSVSQAVVGSTRYETALQLAQSLGQGAGLVMTSGRNFPDALSGGSLAVNSNRRLVLVPPAGQTPGLLAGVWSANQSAGVIQGGTAALSDAQVAAAVTAAE